MQSKIGEGCHGLVMRCSIAHHTHCAKNKSVALAVKLFKDCSLEAHTLCSQEVQEQLQCRHQNVVQVRSCLCAMCQSVHAAFPVARNTFGLHLCPCHRMGSIATAEHLTELQAPLQSSREQPCIFLLALALLPVASCQRPAVRQDAHALQCASAM